LFYAGWQNYKSVSMNYVPIKYVRIEGVFQFLEKDQIKQVLQPLVSTDYFSADIIAIQRAALALPWVAAVRVQRIWPDTLDITISEQKPVLRWGDKQLLNQNGELFSPQNMDELKALPLLVGPDGQEQRLFRIMQEMIAALKENKLTIKKFKVSERRSWNLTLTNGIEMKLGRTEPLQKFKVFLKTLPVLGEGKISAISRVDLRYPNGFAVLWKRGQLPQWESKNGPIQKIQ
jgi:cell division protein FtsQ